MSAIYRDQEPRNRARTCHEFNTTILEGLVNVTLIQEFVEQEAVAMQQVEAARAKLEVFEA
jgi:hypothetical protein